jgi:hypothetical protein
MPGYASLEDKGGTNCGKDKELLARLHPATPLSPMSRWSKSQQSNRFKNIKNSLNRLID